MKNIISILLCIIIALNCAGPKVINGKLYKPYGLINRDEIKDDSIVYEKKKGSVFWSIVFSETIIFPIIRLGYKWYEPVKIKEQKE